MLNDLLLLSGNDIPFMEGSVNIHQPSIKEIGYIGEETFHMGCYLLNLSQDLIEIEDKTNLEKMSDFDILMSIINDKSMSTKAQKIDIFLVLTLLFPEHEIKFSHNEILLIKRNSQGEILEQGQINKENFETFKEIISAMFCLKKTIGNDEYNPQGEMAKKIVEKLKERKKKLAKQKNEEGQKIAIFSRYISILCVGEGKTMQSLFDLTVYQLFDEFQRYELKLSFDYHIQAKMAGAKDLKDVDDWMKDIHP